LAKRRHDRSEDTTIVVWTQTPRGSTLGCEIANASRRTVVEEQLKLSRGKLLRVGAAGTAFGAAALALPGLARADDPESVQVAEIYQLQAAFHRAKTTVGRDVDAGRPGRAPELLRRGKTRLAHWFRSTTA
jgi:hypothetical protein